MQARRGRRRTPSEVKRPGRPLLIRQSLQAIILRGLRPAWNRFDRGRARRADGRRPGQRRLAIHPKIDHQAGDDLRAYKLPDVPVLLASFNGQLTEIVMDE